MTESVFYYRKPPHGVAELGLTVIGAGRIDGQTMPIKRRTLPSYVGVLVTRGSGYLQAFSRHGHRPVPPGSFLWLTPDVPHSYGPNPGTWDEYWVQFEGLSAGAYEDLGYLSAVPAVIDPARPAEVRASLERILELMADPEPLAHHVQAAAVLHTLICAVGRDPSVPEPGPEQKDLGREAVRLLAQTTGPVQVAQIARELAVSRDTLADAVRRLTGLTPTDFVTRHRLERAKVLLSVTDLTVARVARDVGYADPAYFTRLFTRHVGVSPRAFRTGNQDRSMILDQGLLDVERGHLATV